MLSDWFELGGQKFDVSVTEIKEKGTITYTSNTGRTVGIGAKMTLDPLGTFYNYTVNIKRKNSSIDDYDKLYDFLLKPRYSGISVKIVHNQTTLEFEAYVSSAERTLSRIDEKNNIVYWGEMSISITAMEAQVLPSG